jgi:hypothetical protein
MSFSAKRCAYCPRPSFSSQSPTCCICRPCSGDFLGRTEPGARVVSRQICRIVCRRLLKAKQLRLAVRQRVFAVGRPFTAKSANGLGEA